LKVLIITYYWPPAGGPGVQRWLKFVKYLQEFGIEPVVYTVDNPQYPITDVSLEKEVPKNIEILRHPIWEPNNFLSFFKKNKQESAGFLQSNPSFFGKILQYIRANYFIPDARKFWVKPSVKFVENYLLENNIDAIITSGPPHSLHLIGLQLKQKTGITWISDFRDPWTEIDYFHQLPLTKKAIIKHKNLERSVLRESNAVLVVGKTMKENYRGYNKQIYVLTNGFDAEILSEPKSLDAKFTITHVGLMNADRNPKILWKVLLELCEDDIAFKRNLEIKLIGKLSNEVVVSLQDFDSKNIHKIDYLSHREVRIHQQCSQVLLLAINKVPSAKGIITGKIFEYIHAKRPILAIGPTRGDAAEIIKNTQTGFIVDFEDETRLKSVILDLYQDYTNGNLQVKATDIQQYHRRALTEKLSKIIKETVQ